MRAWALKDLRRRDPKVVLVMGGIGFFVLVTVGDDVGQGGRQVCVIPGSQAAIRIGMGTLGMLVIRGMVSMGMTCVVGVLP